MAGESSTLSLNALIEREAANNRKIAQLKTELDTVEHDNKRVADALALLREMGLAPADQGEPEPKTLPDMISAALTEKGPLTGNEIIETIRANWKEDINPENVRPTLWRLLHTDRLKKKGDRYDLP